MQFRFGTDIHLQNSFDRDRKKLSNFFSFRCIKPIIIDIEIGRFTISGGAQMSLENKIFVADW